MGVFHPYRLSSRTARVAGRAMHAYFAAERRHPTSPRETQRHALVLVGKGKLMRSGGVLPTYY
jgi:hypothetical protein